jgi:tRNA 2-thiouridine synthesizing protein B
MSSSPSERRVLHQVVRPPSGGAALAQALDHARTGDVVLLMQDAVELACRAVEPDPLLAAALPRLAVRVLSADLAARGLAGAPLRSGVEWVDDAGWVALAAACDVVVTWY